PAVAPLWLGNAACVAPLDSPGLLSCVWFRVCPRSTVQHPSVCRCYGEPSLCIRRLVRQPRQQPPPFVWRGPPPAFSLCPRHISGRRALGWEPVGRRHSGADDLLWRSPECIRERDHGLRMALADPWRSRNCWSSPAVGVVRCRRRRGIHARGLSTAPFIRNFLA